jgi:divalent metal cation (Fe/Co/Zn/Cd) transporter
MSSTGDSTTAPSIDPREAKALREALVMTPGVQSVGDVVVHRHSGGVLVTAVLGFGPSTPVADVVAVLREVKVAIAAAVPGVTSMVLEPALAGPRDDQNTPTDVIVIRGAD